MKINIFGVGRSGTKAIQLYLSYLIAKKENKVRVNYEPYYWKDRRTLNLNYEGIYHHINSPLIMNKQYNISNDHRRFLLKLVSGDESTVTKFIRANGRIDHINQIIKPDYTFIIIRNLYQVLSSLSKYPWDLLGNNLIYENEWDKLIYEIRKKNIIKESYLNYYINNISNWKDKNALFWYIMNLVALECCSDNVFYIDFNNIARIQEYARLFNLSSNNLDISDLIFIGSNLHGDSPIIDYGKDHNIPLSIGSLNFINDKCIDFSCDNSAKRESIYTNDLYDFFLNDIKRKLKLKNQNKLNHINKYDIKKKTNNIKIHLPLNKNNFNNNIEKLIKEDDFYIKFKYFISQDLIDYLLSNDNKDILILGTDQRSKIVYSFIQKINNMFNKQFKVKGFIDCNESRYNKILKEDIINLDFKIIREIDKLIITTIWEKDFFKKLLKQGISPSKIIFSNHRHPESFWHEIDEEVKKNFYFLSKFKICSSIISRELENFINQTKKSKVIIFGAGGAGKKVLELIDEVNKYLNKDIQIGGIVDNDSKKWGNIFINYEILEPSNKTIKRSDKIVIASTWYKEIKKQLVDMGIKEDNIISAM